MRRLLPRICAILCWARDGMFGGIDRLPMLGRWRRWSGRAIGRCGRVNFGLIVLMVNSRRRTREHMHILYAQELGDHGSRGYLHEDDMVEANAIERVEQREATLDLVRFDHALENVFDGDAFVLACQVVRDGEDG